MNATQTGLLAGLVLGLAGAFGGFDAFLIVLVLGAIGLLVGRALDGRLDLNAAARAGAGPVTATRPRPATSLRPAAERGRLEIHPVVLRKIVEHAADQVPGHAAARAPAGRDRRRRGRGGGQGGDRGRRREHASTSPWS